LSVKTIDIIIEIFIADYKIMYKKIHLFNKFISHKYSSAIHVFFIHDKNKS